METLQKHPAYSSITRYCSYQDRTEKEVCEKLRALGVEQTTALEQFIQILKTEKFLDEERYVASFVRGRLVGKNWGKRKIRLALANKGLAPALVDKELAAIDDVDYLQILQAVATRKMQGFTEKSSRQSRQKLINYLLQKGYEPDIVYQQVQELIVE